MNDALITILMGHRGVGKTTLLQKIASLPSVKAIDLDQEIEKTAGQTIPELFVQGEEVFRKIESSTFQKIIEDVKSPTVIAVGAGWKPSQLPSKSRVVWLRRSTDSDGRVFLNRPRLSSLDSPFVEYKKMFAEREARYRTIATEVLQIPEGYEFGLEGFFQSSSGWNLAADLTLFPHQLKREWLERRLSSGVRRFELRSDLLSAQDLAWAFEHIPLSQILYSIRTPDAIQPPQKVMVDWPLEMGPPKVPADVISVHERKTRLDETLSSLPTNFSGILKLAVEIHSFSELLAAHKWWSESPTKRAFLPRSKSGRWQWYRSLFGPQMPLHFIREDEGSSLDQPYLWQTVMPPQCKTKSTGKFAAVLGSPVNHSRTPMAQFDFFKRRGMPVVAIEVTESEWPQALPILSELGLAFAAVTSPLKNLAAESCHEISGPSLGSVNTLALRQGRWFGTNTDIDGLVALQAHVPHGKKLALWGGGGTRAAVESVFQKISTFSARQGALGSASPDVLLWAVGRSREFQWPPLDWRLQMVVDLNYTENSPGLELAAQRGIPYVSGLAMFEGQAEGQRQFWQGFL